MPVRFDLRDAAVGGRAPGHITYDGALFTEARIERLWTHLGGLLRAAAAEPHARVGDLVFLPEAESARLRAFSGEDWIPESAPRGESEVPTLGLMELFDRQVERRPDALAVVSAEGAVTYRELRRRADGLATVLHERCRVVPEDRVAIVIDRSAALVAAMVGVVRAGCAYVPVDLGLGRPRRGPPARERGEGGDHPRPRTRRGSRPWGSRERG